MPRKKKDGRFINYYIDRRIYERLERYASAKGQQMTTAIERILQEHLDAYEAELKQQGGMVMYCPNCNVLLEGSRCAICGSREVRDPRPEDFCYLTEKELIWANALEDIFKDHSIPYVTKNTMGAGLTAKMGHAMERMRFYVPYSCYGEARQLEAEFFCQNISEG